MEQFPNPTITSLELHDELIGHHPATPKTEYPQRLTKSIVNATTVVEQHLDPEHYALLGEL